jgi:hypothetical protein
MSRHFMRHCLLGSSQKNRRQIIWRSSFFIWQMTETTIDTTEVSIQTTEVAEVMTPTALLDLPVARLQIVQSNEVVNADWLERAMLEPALAQNADGLWVLSVRRQGEHSKFNVPFIGSEILLADPEFGLVVVLVGYHGSSTEKYGRLGYMTQKGQFYRYYQQQADGDWNRVEWRAFNDDLRQLIIDLPRPEWGRMPGKLRIERKTTNQIGKDDDVQGREVD